MSQYAFYVAYDGPALESSQMDVRELAPALIALADAFDEANKILNGDRAEIHLDVKGSFKSGCFGIDLVGVQGVTNSILNFFGNIHLQDASAVAGLLGFSAGSAATSLIAAIRWMRGRKITKVDVEGKNATIYIGDKYFRTEKAVIDMLHNTRIRKAFEAAIAAPLRKSGMQSFAVAAGEKEPFCIVEKEDAEYFLTPPINEELLDEKEYETSVQVVGVTFKDNNKWRFSDGTSHFYADMLDEIFLSKISKHEIAFAKDDILTVVMRERQSLADDEIKTERTVLKVLAHRTAALQLGLPISPQGTE
ncbi:hypothetical protein LJC46_02100 [Desulfovibrio sp. OttesenSCG-928-G15]|nr:hypothetical protein [Desulfovibrio sp. OttesenSCG-928-G15]